MENQINSPDALLPNWTAIELLIGYTSSHDKGLQLSASNERLMKRFCGDILGDGSNPGSES